jgi:hypothetical protein
MKRIYLLTCFIVCFLMMNSICLLAQMNKKIYMPNVINTARQNNVLRTAVCGVDTILITTQAQINNFTTTYPACTTPKYVLIDGIGASPAITNLAGLSSLTGVVNKLQIRNTNITNLTALNSINFIGDSLVLERNNLLTSIGLTNLDTLGSIYLKHLPLLTSVAGLCNNMHKTGFIYIDSTNLSNLNGLHTIDTITGFTGLDISFSPIANLSALNNLKYIYGYFRLSNNNLQTSIGLTNLKNYYGFLFDNLPLLNSVAGLTNNLTSGNISTFWFINTGLPNLTGLEGMTGSANFYINGNNNLTNINGLQNLSGTVGGGISIWANALLTSLLPLKNVTAVNGTVEVSYNNSLTNLNGLKNVLDIQNGLWIAGNSLLTNLDSLNTNLIIRNELDLSTSTKDSVRIYDNLLLALCSAPAICNYLSTSSAAFINNNTGLCNSIVQIQANCNSMVIDNEVEDNCCTNNANTITENVTINGKVGQYDQVIDDFVDQYDTYRMIVRKAGDVRIEVTAKRDSCNANYLNMFLLDKLGYGFTTTFLTANFSSLPCDSTLVRTIDFLALENDTFYLQLQANNQIKYSLKYYLIDSANNDVEPNNQIPEATFINAGEVKFGHTLFKRLANGINDYQDNYKAYLPNGGKIKVILKTKNKDPFPRIYPSTYNYSFTVNNVIANGIYPPNTYFLNNIERTDTLDFCGLEGDTVYFKFSGFSTFEYEFSYTVISAGLPPSDFEPNDTKETATTLNYNQTLLGHIKTSKLNVIDDADYYRLIIPKSGKLKLIVPATNLACGLSNSMTIGLYNKSLFSNTSIPPSYAIADTLFYCGIIADTAYIKISATDAWAYSVRYEIVDTVTNDAEQNVPWQQLPLIQKNETKKGTLRFLNNYGADYDDTYKIITNCADTIKLKYKFTNRACGTPNDSYIIQVYDKNANTLFSTGISNIANGNFGIDSLAVAVNRADTFFVNVYSNYPSSYEISLQNTAPSGAFTITGADSSCFQTKTYKAQNICAAGNTYHWSLSGGGTLNATDSIANINWTSSGQHTISLYLSNAIGSSLVKTYTVNVIAPLPITTPTIIANGRNLTINNAIAGVSYQWYKNNTAILNAIDSFYFAADSGTYTLKIKNYCSNSNTSNAIFIALPIQNQSIIFNPPTPDIVYSNTAFAIIKATTSSNLAVAYSIVSGNAILILDSIKPTSTGLIIIAANQAGNLNFYSAPTKYDTINVTSGNQTINFPAIANRKLSDTSITLLATSSAGLPISYSIISGNAVLNNNILTMTGVGNVTVQAAQGGGGGFNAATPMQQSFCIGIRTLASITGEAQPCLGAYKYTTTKIIGANYVWALSGGGVLTTNNDTAFVTWNSFGNYTLTVKANSSCDAAFSSTTSLNITSNNFPPTAVSNMFPANNTSNQQLPLLLSWQPGLYSSNFDLYIWDSTQAQPILPFASNINQLNYTVPANSLLSNTTFKWRVVSKNPCNTIAGPIQHFKTIPLPDLKVLNVQAPTTAFSGQNITINWSVKNLGPGKTKTNESWTDAVFISFDSIAAFVTPPVLGSFGWDITNIPSRPLLVASKTNLTALDSAQQYNNSINYTLPIAVSGPIYVYVITNFENSILETTKNNDTARALQPMVVTLSPTPDLRVDSVFAPNTVFSGSTANITYKVKNYGANTPINSNWIDKIYISNTITFNSNAVPLTKPKINETYYPNITEADILKSTILQTDSFYTISQEVVIPNFINGTFYIHVKTNVNGNNYFYEGAAVNNNTNSKAIQVLITPTPKLEISGLNIADYNLSNTQPFTINYNTINTGFYDNIEKNKGHYAVQGGTGCTRLLIPPPPGGRQTNTTNLRDGGGAASIEVGPPSISLTSNIEMGSSAWVDYVYFSPDSNALTTSNAYMVSTINHYDVTHNVAYDESFIIKECVSGGIIGLPPPQDFTSYNKNTFNVIKPNSSFTSSKTLSVPANIPAGNYYMYVWANANKGVFEFPANNEIKRIALPIQIQNPDLVVGSVTAPTTVFGGQSFNVSYTINTNTSNVFNALRRDDWYVSNSPLFDNTAILIGQVGYGENVINGVPAYHSFNYSFPFGTTGTKYFYIKTNIDNLIAETNFANNVSIAAAVSIATPPASATCDLQVTAISIADSIFAKLPMQIQYTVTNSGLGTTQGSWVDSIYVSCSPVYNPATATFLTKVPQTRSIIAGGQYTQLHSFISDFANNLNPCFPIQQYNNAYFFVKTNANNVVYEGANTNNNFLNTSLKTFINPFVDLIITKFNAPDDSTIVARPFFASWTIKNLKYNYTSDYFEDALYFSPDSVFNANAVIATNSKSQNRGLTQNQTYNDSTFFGTPNIPTGNYYIFMRTNNTNNIYQENGNNNLFLLKNNLGAAKKIHVTRPPLPDFVDSITNAPNTIAVGQPLKVEALISNIGLGSNFPTNFSNELWLSSDFQINAGDFQLATSNTNKILTASQSYTDSLKFIMPNFIAQGNYVLIWRTNVNNSFYETNSNNNLAFKYITVLRPSPADLVVTNINFPDTAILGYTIDTVKWTVLNNAINAANGYSTDGIYLSKSTVLDSTAILLGMNNRFLQMLPLQKDTLKKQIPTNNLTEGLYNVMVKADVLNNILESDKNNNVTLANKKIYIKVKPLPLNVLVNDNLSNTVNRFYKLVIPDSLRGSTILVTLKSNDSLSNTNQLFIGAGYIPNAGNFTYAYDNPNFGNQQIVMTSVYDSVYYITVRNTNSALPQSISLKAVKLPFAVLNVQSNSGGNIGNVTIKISGSLFNNSMTAKLINAGTTINASQVYFVNSTTVFATFNLAAKPIGIYSVELYKTTDSTTAILANSFSIVPANNGGLVTGSGVNGIPGNGNAPGCYPNAASGLNSQLVTELIIADKIFIPFPFTFTINYKNPTNVDVPAQTKMVFTDNNVLLALTQAGLATGTTSLNISLSEPGGPPGIIRAGASGTITIFGKAPNNTVGHTILNVTIK